MVKNVKNRKLTIFISTLYCSLFFSSSLFAFQKGSTEDFLGHEVGITYHTAEQAVSSKEYLPVYPEEGTPEFEADKIAYLHGYNLKGTERWQQAIQDADLHIANVAKIFSQSLGITISPETTPTLYKMFGDLLVDSADNATKTAKEFYMRKRPFVYFGNHSCQPIEEENRLRQNGSFPSGHTAYGWTLALVLAQIAPSHAETIIKRGYEFGQSRVICGAHWQTDVNAGRIVGAVEYSKLQTIAKFQEDLRKASEEINQQYSLLK